LQSNQFQIPEISLPKGGGALKGIDEKFTVNAVNGTNSVSVPIPVSPSRGFSPSLSLSYSSGFGDGAYGLGWSVGIPFIKRKTEQELPKYQDEIESDTFILSGAEDLIPFLKEDANGNWVNDIRESSDGVFTIKKYRPRIEGLWARIEQWKNKQTGIIHWRTISPSNVTTFYGVDANSRVANPEPGKEHQIYEWLISHTFDDKGNLTIYKYKHEDLVGVENSIYEKNRSIENCTNIYLKKVCYGNKIPYYLGDSLPNESNFLFETVFDYGEHDLDKPTPDDLGTWNVRKDPFSNFRSGFDIRTYRKCERVLLFHKFDELPINPCLVSSLDLIYHDYPGKVKGDDNIEGFSYLKSLTQKGFIYDPTTSEFTSKSLPPLNYYYQEHEWKTDVESVTTENIYNAPIGIDFQNYQWVDLYSEGVSGILSEKNNAWYYKENMGNGEFTPAKLISPKPSFAGVSNGSLQLQDLEGVGDTYLVNWASEPKGFFRLTDNEEWQPFKAFEKVPNENLLANPNARFIDLNGDGLPEILISENDVFHYYESDGEKGFDPAISLSKAIDEEAGPRIVFADVEQSIFLADMSGDGLADIVRIRNGHVCYWANMGHGKFSQKITMADAPIFDAEDIFNPNYLKLADIDGSGTTDIIYLAKNKVDIWMNLSGNAWSKKNYTISSFPAIDNLADISVIDLLGTGTSSIVWSSPLPSDSNNPLRYVDLMNGKKPHVLNRYENNMGKEVSFEYKPSTQYYLEDKKNGTPWATKLPFPMHIVSKVKSEDKIRETVFINTYSYHHGYFDGKEREFRGFGRVEQLDTESFNEFKINDAQNIQEEIHHQAPVKTVTWFHTGAALQKEFLTEKYKTEYFKNINLPEYDLPKSEIPSGLNTQEWCEALRACKSLTLRQEVYSNDGSDRSDLPYSTAQTNYDIQLVQPIGDNKHASFIITPKETLTYNYDRNPVDPRISHSIVLETDELGMVKQSASIIYPRIARPQAPNDIPQEVWNEQSKRHLVLSETEHTDDIEDENVFRIRSAYESKSYELLNFAEPAEKFLTKDLLLTELSNNTTEVSFEQDINDNSQVKRLASHARVYFLKNDLSGGLALGQRESLGIGYRSFQMAFTPGLITKHYGTRVTNAMMLQAGYLHSEGDANWWIPSVMTIFDTATARSNFYLAEGSEDAFGKRTFIEFDQYTLLRKKTTDAIGNAVTIDNDYRTLSPHTITDPNGDQSLVQTDELGLAIKSAIKGKNGEGDTLADPTSRMKYDLFNWMNHQKPNYVHSFAREQHGPSNPRWQESYVYSDGGGAVIMSKIQAEEGDAKIWNASTKQVDDVYTDNRWVGNGRTILNNKGNPIKHYEPYFSTTHEYESEAGLVETGVSPLMFYDAVGRNIRTDLPNGTFTKVVFDPWHAKNYDVNDTAKDSQWYADRGSPDPNTESEPLNNQERRAAWLAAKHYDTPSVVHTDSLGRAIYTLADYGNGKTTAVGSETDLFGRYSKVFDQIGREVASGNTNMIGAAIYGESAEKGETWTFLDVLGRMVKIWDNDLRTFRTTYDDLHRPVSSFVSENGNEILFSHIVYGDIHADLSKRLKGKVYQTYDQAGVVTIAGYNFKGNPVNVKRRLTKDYKNNINWQSLENLTSTTAIDNAANSQLETETFTISSTFDALNRPMEVTLPDNTIIRTTYNEANYLETLEAKVRGQGNFRTFLEDQNYDAKGQRQYVKYGNGTITKYFYDPDTFRLTNLLTQKIETDPRSNSLQDIRYTYDPVGNITHMVDDAQQTHYFRNAVMNPESSYEYDAIYQLAKATGRELAGITNNTQRNHRDLPFLSQMPHINDVTAVRNYREEYTYDDLGNILEFKHRDLSNQNTGSWTRRYKYHYQDDSANRSNQLKATSIPGDSLGTFSGSYSHDAHGNMTRMPHLQYMIWNYMDQLREVDLGGGGNAYYVYGTSGQRMRKIIEKSNGKREERIYIGGVEFYREFNGNIKRFERETVHISDESGRLAQIDTKIQDDNNRDSINQINTPVLRYQYSNHLGSASLETDVNANVISYEEYHPFGTTSYRSSKSNADISLKRYRFTGKERDNETGLDYFGFRFYASWLGRWTSSDPIGVFGGINLYRYCSNKPISLKDPNGLKEERFGATLPESASPHERNMAALDAGRLNVDPSDDYYTKEDGVWHLGKTRNLGKGSEQTQIEIAKELGSAIKEIGESDIIFGGTYPSVEIVGDKISKESDSTPRPDSLTHIAPAVEKLIWGKSFGKRGYALEHLYNNDFLKAIKAQADNRPLYDIETDSHVKQIKSTKGSNSKTTRATVSKATRDAGKAVKSNSSGTMGGKSLQAVIITPTDGPKNVGGDIDAGYKGIRKPIPNSSAPEHVRGIPGKVGTIGKGFTVIGSGFSAYSLVNDIREEDYSMATGDAISTTAGGLEVYAITTPGASIAGVSAMSAGIALGGIGIAVTSGISGYRAFKAGDNSGAVAGGVGVIAGAAVTIGVVAGAPVLIVAGLVAASGVGVFHLGRYFEVW